MSAGNSDQKIYVLCCFFFPEFCTRRKVGVKPCFLEVNTVFGPEAPRVAAVKKLNLVHRGKCRGFFVKFFVAIFPGN